MFTSGSQVVLLPVLIVRKWWLMADVIGNSLTVFILYTHTFFC